MEELHIKCPCCGNEMEVTLRGKKSSLVLCVCGHCKSPLMMMEGEVFELDREEFRGLRQKLARVVDALRESVETHQDVVTPLLEKALAREEAKKNTDEKAQSHTGKISQEEVDKLRKELDNCVDVSDFIDKL